MLTSHPTETAAVEAAKTLIDLHIALRDLLSPGLESDEVDVTLTKKQVAFLQVMIERELFADPQ